MVIYELKVRPVEFSIGEVVFKPKYTYLHDYGVLVLDYTTDNDPNVYRFEPRIVHEGFIGNFTTVNLRLLSNGSTVYKIDCHVVEVGLNVTTNLLNFTTKTEHILEVSPLQYN